MKLATYSFDGRTRTGIVVGDQIIASGIDGTMIDLIRDWSVLKPRLEAKAAAPGLPGANAAAAAARPVCSCDG